MEREVMIAKLESLESALFEGVLEVDFQGKKVTYRSLDEMQRIVTGLRRALGYDKPVLEKIIPVFEKY